jgi:hypothetical protein
MSEDKQAGAPIDGIMPPCTPQLEPPPEVSQPPVEVVHVSKEDRQRAEIINLRKLVAQQQASLIQMQLKEANQRTADLNAEGVRLQKELEEKYGINLATHDIRPTDGAVIPKGATNPLKGLVERILGQ